MTYPTKIATCCHCGTKAALTLDVGRHELSCSSCGAPLHDLKRVPQSTQPPKPAKRQAVSHHAPLRSFQEAPKAAASKKKKPRKVKKRKGWFRDIAEEVFDFVDDIFD
jgi:hypothetical protein